MQVILPESPGPVEEHSLEIDEGMDPGIRMTLGKYSINNEEFQSLKEKWHVQQIVLICGSDGGLKGQIGTSGYVIYTESGTAPLIRGFSAEEQATSNSSSTRQELLAQLCVEYWVLHLINKLGEPDSPIQVQLITDSQASITIRSRTANSMFMTEFLKPDVDVAMEIHRCREETNHSHLEIIKVTSHILETEAPDVTHWRLNKEADELATEAREAVESGRFLAQKPRFLSGARVMCVAQGHLCTASIKVPVYNSIYARNTKEFLCDRYNWTERVFNLVDWELHYSALSKYSGVQKVTVFKYIHGWLATNKRRYREGGSSTPQCELCSELEDSAHIFCCQNELLKEARRIEFWALKMQLRRITEPEVCIALEAGLGSIGGDEFSRYADEFTTNKILDIAIRDQNDIGWDHFAKGRIARAWSNLEKLEAKSTHDDGARVKINKAAIDYGLKLWNHRNKLVHGNDPKISKMESRKIQQIIEILYTELLPMSDDANRWLFERDKARRLEDSYILQVAWVDCVKRVFSKEYEELKTRWGAKFYTEGAILYHKERRKQF